MHRASMANNVGAQISLICVLSRRTKWVVIQQCQWISQTQKKTTSVQSDLTKRPHRRRTWTVVPILYNGSPHPPQNCPFPCSIWTPYITDCTWFFGLIRVHNPNGISISIGSAVSAGLTISRQTDRQTTLLRL